MDTSRLRWISLATVAACAPAWGQCDIQTLTADDGLEGDQFGSSVAISGEWLATGAPESDIANEDAGAVYIYQRQGDAWAYFDTITSSDAAPFDDFGRSVSIDGTALIVGAPGKDNIIDNEGAAYIFRFQSGNWVQEQRITHMNPQVADRFGWDVAIDGDRAVIGAWGDDTVDNSAGAGYVFHRAAGVWSQEDVLTADDGTSLAQLGRSVDIDGDRVILGAWQDDDAGFFTGAAYTYTRTGSNWIQEDKLIADDADAFRWFGVDVDLQGSLALIGAYGDEESAGLESGAAYVFVRSGATWSQQDKLIASDGAMEARFGSAVALDGVNAWIGAPQDPEAADLAGAAYHFRAAGANWNQIGKYTSSDGGATAQLGMSVAAFNDLAAAGAPLWNVGATEDAGALLAFASCVCPGDFNGDGSLNVVDFVNYQQAWVAMNPGADCDDSGVFNIVDYVCYSLLFQAGCP